MTGRVDNLAELPKGWLWARLGEISHINPRFDLNSPSNDIEVTFLPMTNVQELSGVYDASIIRKLSEVRKGYTSFKDGDVIFAKITPCMENGKVAVLKGLKNGIGFGSTEFHVIRPLGCSSSKYFFYYLVQEGVRKDAQHHMTGTAGQLRVPTSYLQDRPLPLPPLPEQHRIVAKIEELFSDLDAGVAALKRVKANLKRYRQAVLKSAFGGKLTAEWREKHKGELEPASVLLERIREEWKKNTKGKLKELPPVDTSNLPELPEGWLWTRLGHMAKEIQYGYTASAASDPVGPKFLRITDIQNGIVIWDEVPYCKIEESEKAKYFLRTGDLVFARTGATVGKSYLIQGDIPEAIFASYLIKVQLESKISTKFVYNYFQSRLYWEQIVRQQIGIGQPNVNGTTLSKLHIPLPSVHEQNIIVEELESRLSIADEVEQTIGLNLKRAERLRQSILKRAFEGKLVQQDSTDEPASVLLERIKQEKARMTAVNQRLSKKKSAKSHGVAK